MKTYGKTAPGISVGSSSVLMVFVALMLTTFAALSLASANMDVRLSRRVAQNTADYYAADSRAEELLAQIDRSVLESSDLQELADCLTGELGLPAPEAVYAADGVQTLLTRFSVPIGESGRLLEVELDAAARWMLREEGETEVRVWRVTVDDADWETMQGGLGLFGSGQTEGGHSQS